MLCSAGRGRPADVTKMPMNAAGGEGLTAMAGIAQAIREQRLASARARARCWRRIVARSRMRAKLRKRKWGRKV